MYGVGTNRTTVASGDSTTSDSIGYSNRVGRRATAHQEEWKQYECCNTNRRRRGSMLAGMYLI